MDQSGKRGKVIMLLMVTILLFAFLLMIGNLLIYAFETGVNEAIKTPGDAFRAIESVFHFSGLNAVTPITLGGRITLFVFFLLAIILGIVFAAQVFGLVQTITFRPWFKKIDKKLATEEIDLQEGLDENQELEKEILNQQTKILSYEENILDKLDKLRKEKP